MGMYTELIFGAKLKKNTPASVIERLKFMCQLKSEYVEEKGRVDYIFNCGSYYFGISEPLSKMWFDDIVNTWRISTRSNIKNYDNEIETFLEWIKPYIDKGSGTRDFYAIVTYEEASEPTIYYLRSGEEE